MKILNYYYNSLLCKPKQVFPESVVAYPVLQTAHRHVVSAYVPQWDILLDKPAIIIE